MIRKLGIGLGAIAALYFVAAIVLVVLPGPGHSERAAELRRAIDAGETTVAEAAAGLAKFGGVSHEQVYPFETVFFKTRNGTKIHARVFSSDSSTTILIVHGLDGSSAQFNRASGLLRETTGANVVAMDLRGHGLSEGARWDVDYVGQHEEDVADVIAALHKRNPGGDIVLLGHSMGGGISIAGTLYPALRNDGTRACQLGRKRTTRGL